MRGEALRIIAIFFQIRCAHHFIVKGLVGNSACMRAVRRILLTRNYSTEPAATAPDHAAQLAAAVAAGTLDSDALLSGYCALLYERCGNLEEVARRTNLDRRTVKRYLAQRSD